MLLGENVVVKLDRELRLMFEEVVDNHLKDPKGSEEDYSAILEVQGISSNFETILAYIAGSVFGCEIIEALKLIDRSKSK